jgi:glucuronosyltransferase
LIRFFSAFSYRENARILSRAYRDRPVSPLETAIWWTEHVARDQAGSRERAKGEDLFWWQHHLIDVAFVLITVSAMLIYILFRLIKLLLSLLYTLKGKLGNGTRNKGERRKEE